MTSEPSIGHVILDLLERSVLVQSFLTLMLMASIVYMWVSGRQVPSDLTQFTSIVLAFWMGSKAQNEANRALIARYQNREE